MCVVKTPKIKNPTPENDKPLPVLTNPILDGIDPSTKSLRIGRSSLRLPKGEALPNKRPTPNAPPVMGNPVIPPRFRPFGINV